MDGWLATQGLDSVLDLGPQNLCTLPSRRKVEEQGVLVANGVLTPRLDQEVRQRRTLSEASRNIAQIGRVRRQAAPHLRDRERHSDHLSTQQRLEDRLVEGAEATHVHATQPARRVRRAQVEDAATPETQTGPRALCKGLSGCRSVAGHREVVGAGRTVVAIDHEVVGLAGHCGEARRKVAVGSAVALVADTGGVVDDEDIEINTVQVA